MQSGAGSEVGNLPRSLLGFSLRYLLKRHTQDGLGASFESVTVTATVTADTALLKTESGELSHKVTYYKLPTYYQRWEKGAMKSSLPNSSQMARARWREPHLPTRHLLI